MFKFLKYSRVDDDWITPINIYYFAAWQSNKLLFSMVPFENLKV